MSRRQLPSFAWWGRAKINLVNRISPVGYTLTAWASQRAVASRPDVSYVMADPNDGHALRHKIHNGVAGKGDSVQPERQTGRQHPCSDQGRHGRGAGRMFFTRTSTRDSFSMYSRTRQRGIGPWRRALIALLCSIWGGGRKEMARAGWVDPDSPPDTYLKEFGGREFNLVFSDEFNRDGRTFEDGGDPRWTSLNKNDYTNNALQFYSDEMVRNTIPFSFPDIDYCSCTLVNDPKHTPCLDQPRARRGVTLAFGSCAASRQTWLGRENRATHTCLQRRRRAQ